MRFLQALPDTKGNTRCLEEEEVLEAKAEEEAEAGEGLEDQALPDQATPQRNQKESVRHLAFMSLTMEAKVLLIKQLIHGRNSVIIVELNMVHY